MRQGSSLLGLWQGLNEAPGTQNPPSMQARPPLKAFHTLQTVVSTWECPLEPSRSFQSWYTYIIPRHLDSGPGWDSEGGVRASWVRARPPRSLGGGRYSPAGEPSRQKEGQGGWRRVPEEASRTSTAETLPIAYGPSRPLGLQSCISRLESLPWQSSMPGLRDRGRHSWENRSSRY